MFSTTHKYHNSTTTITLDRSYIFLSWKQFHYFIDWDVKNEIYAEIRLKKRCKKWMTKTITKPFFGQVSNCIFFRKQSLASEMKAELGHLIIQVLEGLKNLIGTLLLLLHFLFMNLVIWFCQCENVLEILNFLSTPKRWNTSRNEKQLN